MTSVAYRWDVESFLRAHDLGAFDGHVELVEGEVWQVGIGDWHGLVTGDVFEVLVGQGRLTSSTLPSDRSLPDPDVWVQRRGAEPAYAISPRLSAWRTEDVLLVVEVSDETRHEDLTIKAGLYARAGWTRYWVVARDGVHDHTEPSLDGYGSARLHGPADDVTLPDGTVVPVSRLLDV